MNVLVAPEAGHTPPETPATGGQCQLSHLVEPFSPPAVARGLLDEEGSGLALKNDRVQMGEEDREGHCRQGQ